MCDHPEVRISPASYSSGYWHSSHLGLLCPARFLHCGSSQTFFPAITAGAVAAVAAAEPGEAGLVAAGGAVVVAGVAEVAEAGVAAALAVAEARRVAEAPADHGDDTPTIIAIG